MAYQKLNWLNKGETGAIPINKDNLNHMDNGIEANDKKLSDILNQESRILTFNEEYVYSSDLQSDCFKIGKMVFLNIHTIAFKKGFEESGTQFISGLPKASTGKFFIYMVAWKLVAQHLGAQLIKKVIL